MDPELFPHRVDPKSRDWERTTFGPFSRRVIFALAEALFTDPDAPSDRGAAARFSWAVSDVDAMISNASAGHRILVRVTLVLLELLPLVIVGRFARCSSLPIDARVAYLSRLDRHRITQLALPVVLWKTLLTMVYFEHPEAAPILGYDGRHEHYLRVGKKPRAKVAEHVEHVERVHDEASP